MKGLDKFLIGIIIGAVVLVAVVAAVLLTRPAVDYLPDDTPEGIVHNYLLALQRRDYQRAYGYLSPRLRGHPETLMQFQSDIEHNTWQFQSGASVSLEVLSARVTGYEASVEVSESHLNRGGFFPSGPSGYHFYVTLRQEDGQWRIIASDNYFAWCWQEVQGCQPLLPR